MRKILTTLCLLGLIACAEQNTKVVPGIVPNSAQEPKVVKVMPNNVIGAVEKIYLPPMKSAFTKNTALLFGRPCPPSRANQPGCM